MIDRIIDLIAAGWDSLTPFVVVDEYERGIILRLGKYHRTINPGLNYKWPIIEYDVVIETVVTTMMVGPQTLTTDDGKNIVISTIVKYDIQDVKPYLLEITDRDDVLNDVTLGAIKKIVSESTYAGLKDLEPPVTKAVRAEVKRYGFKVHKITFADLAQIRTIRLMTDE